MEKEVLKPYSSLDVLYYYSQVSRYLEKFLAGREIATKTILKNFVFLKRGSNSLPLYIQDLRKVDKKMIKLRASHGLGEVKNQLTDKQILIWRYFVPRKLVNFFYATNTEKPGKPIDRIFIDIDRQACSPDDARKVCSELIKEIKQDSYFNKLLKFKIFIMWTGSSFHIYLLLNKKINLDFYNQYLSYGKNKPDSFITKWAQEITRKTKIQVKPGHEREKLAIILDSSNTPSGKLARAPFSLHIKGYDEADGVSIPLAEKDLENRNIILELKKLTPQKVLKNIKNYAKLL
jgi:DNA primase